MPSDTLKKIAGYRSITCLGAERKVRASALSTLQCLYPYTRSNITNTRNRSEQGDETDEHGYDDQPPGNDPRIRIDLQQPHGENTKNQPNQSWPDKHRIRLT